MLPSTDCEDVFDPSAQMGVGGCLFWKLLNLLLVWLSWNLAFLLMLVALLGGTGFGIRSYGSNPIWATYQLYDFRTLLSFSRTIICKMGKIGCYITTIDNVCESLAWYLEIWLKLCLFSPKLNSVIFSCGIGWKLSQGYEWSPISIILEHSFCLGLLWLTKASGLCV